MEATIPFWSHWYFHIPNYLLAAVFYTLFGRFLFSLFVPHDWPNYIWRGFRYVTDWSLAAVRPITPWAIPYGLLPLVAAFWVMAVRVAFNLVMISNGWAPTLQPVAPQ